MLTGQQYRESLRDGRQLFMDGSQIDDIATHPVLGPCVDRVADEYDRLHATAGAAAESFMRSPRNQEDLRAKLPTLHQTGMLASATYLSLMTLATAAGRIEGEVPDAAERIRAYVADAAARDLRIPQCITDAKGDRSLAPAKQSDPDAYVHIVERRSDGVVLRGAKLHISAASLGHDLLVMPTKSMKPGEEEYAVACTVPLASAGVRVVNTPWAPEGLDGRDFPLTARNHYPEGFVVFDDVFVPTERVFLDGETPLAGVFAHSLGLWERLSGLSGMADDADLIVGLGLLITEANGTGRIGHVKDKLADLMIQATLIRGSLEAAITHCVLDEQGFAVPDELYTNAGKYYGAATFGQMAAQLVDIAGGSVMTVPAVADFENPDTAADLQKYMSGAKPGGGDERAAIFRAIRDLVASSHGGWKLVTSIQAGGGLYAQKTVTRKHYDDDRARQAALAVIGSSHAPHSAQPPTEVRSTATKGDPA